MPKKNEKLTDAALASYVQQKIQAAMNREDGDLSDVREGLYNQYYGARYGNEREGHSSFVTREVMEAVEWAAPELIRLFFGNDRVVAFEPVGPEDEGLAQQETDIINYAVERANDGGGFLAVHNFIKDALLNPTAYVKVWMEEKETRKVHDATEIPAEQLQEFLNDPSIELLEQDSRQIMVPQPGAPGGPMIPVEVFDLKYRETKQEKRMRVVGVPAEEVLIDSELTTTDLDEAAFVCHRSRQTYTNLVKMGYDRAKLDRAVSSQEEMTWNEERVNRLFYEDESPAHNEEENGGSDDSMRSLWVHECTAWVDTDGDGVAEYRRIVLIGNEVFENEETTYQPLVAMSSIIIPHKHNGLSVAQLVQDIQTLLSELTRQLLDNVRSINNRRRFISEDALIEDGRTYSAAMNPASVLIPVRGLARDAVFPDPSLPIIADLLPVIQDQRQATSMRTGVSPENSLDPGTLKQSTYGAFMGAMEKANSRLELFARVMAETGLKKMYLKAHQLHRMHPDIAKAIRLRNEWVQVDPRNWRDRTDIKVNVGLGFANKQQMLTAVMQTMELQQQVAPMGLADVQTGYNALSKFSQLSGIGSAEFYFKDPSAPDWQPPEPQPSPEAELMKAQAQALIIEAQTKQFEAQARVQDNAAKTQSELQVAQLEAQKAQIEGEIRLREIGIKEREADSRDTGNRVDNIKTVAETENAEADTELKAAQTVKALADAGKAKADAERPDPKPAAGGSK